MAFGRKTAALIELSPVNVVVKAREQGDEFQEQWRRAAVEEVE
jgi:hypothetical protein